MTHVSLERLAAHRAITEITTNWVNNGGLITRLKPQRWRAYEARRVRLATLAEHYGYVHGRTEA